MALLPSSSRATLHLTALTLLFSFLITAYGGSGDQAGFSHQEKPLVYFAVLARNAGYLLRNYFGYLEALNYPKERIVVG